MNVECTFVQNLLIFFQEMSVHFSLLTGVRQHYACASVHCISLENIFPDYSRMLRILDWLAQIARATLTRTSAAFCVYARLLPLEVSLVYFIIIFLGLLLHTLLIINNPPMQHQNCRSLGAYIFCGFISQEGNVWYILTFPFRDVFIYLKAEMRLVLV